MKDWNDAELTTPMTYAPIWALTKTDDEVAPGYQLNLAMLDGEDSEYHHLFGYTEIKSTVLFWKYAEVPQIPEYRSE